MKRRPPRFPPTATPFPHTTLFRSPLMKCGPVCTPGYLAETSGQLPPGGKLKHVDFVAAGRLVDLADPRRCRQIRTQLASRNGEILFAGQFVGDRKPDTRCTKSG